MKETKKPQASLEVGRNMKPRKYLVQILWAAAPEESKTFNEDNVCQHCQKYFHNIYGVDLLAKLYCHYVTGQRTSTTRANYRANFLKPFKSFASEKLARPWFKFSSGRMKCRKRETVLVHYFD